MGDRINEADHLAREGRQGKASEILRSVLEDDPGDAAASLSYARILGSLGHEREAIPRYEQAIAGGLSDKETEEAALDLGSSYRTVGEPAKAAEVLKRGLARFPENQALRAFLAMSLHDLGEYREATATLLRCLTEFSSDAWIVRYQRPINHYADDMHEESPDLAADALVKGPSGFSARGAVAHHETLRGAIRRGILVRDLIQHLPPPPAAIVDVGGGAGRVAIPLAKKGYEVTILDPSEEALARARQALEREDAATGSRVRLVQGRGEEAPGLLGETIFDATTCHGVLPSVEDPGPLVRALVRLVRPGSLISVLAKNADALAMRPALQGHYRKALGSLEANWDEGPFGTLTRADTVAGLRDILESAGAEVIAWHGVRSFTEHLGDTPAVPDVLEDALELEWAAGRKDPYRGVARWIHLLGRRAER
ncbi:tetratricopeptide repeat protein [Rubrobacter aplysinae]|uniref:tetratricopeptide repeat protein n=1 Tax=Rubrobacter aplysinae TaxID=909625 RepID=UPI00069F53D5|nr:tetratricopeptide repeat protein [Rubrobacter aplysinae]